jgi:dTDP-4-dehydrorhamnose 3,5-epimerase
MADMSAGIEGVSIAPLAVIADERGAVLHMLRSDWPSFTQFGEVYFSEINPGGVKAWKRHRKATQHLAAPVGRVKFVLYDDRAGSPTVGAVLRLELGRPDAYSLLTIAPGIWYGWQALASYPSILANCSDFAHDPAESDHVDSIPGLTGEWQRGSGV